MAKIPKFNESVSLQRFRKTVENIETNIQLTDVAFTIVIKDIAKSVDKEADLREVLNVSKENYTRLNHPVKQSKAMFNTVKKKNIEFGIIQLYNAFSNYLKDLLSEMVKHKPELIVDKAAKTKLGEDKENLTFTFASIVKAGNYENIQAEMVKRVFRKLEDEQSTTTLLEKVVESTKIQIDRDLKKNALAYLELRHLFIHNRGYVDEKFAKNYGEKFTPNLANGNKIPQTYEVFKEASNSIDKLCKKIDELMLQNDIIPERIYKKNETMSKSKKS